MIYFAHGDELNQAAEASNTNPIVFIAIGAALLIAGILIGLAISKSKPAAKDSSKKSSDKSE